MCSRTWFVQSRLSDQIKQSCSPEKPWIPLWRQPWTLWLHFRRFWRQTPHHRWNRLRMQIDPHRWHHPRRKRISLPSWRKETRSQWWRYCVLQRSQRHERNQWQRIQDLDQIASQLPYRRHQTVRSLCWRRYCHWNQSSLWTQVFWPWKKFEVSLSPWIQGNAHCQLGQIRSPWTAPYRS